MVDLFGEQLKKSLEKLGLSGLDSLEIHNARLSDHNEEYSKSLYKRLQRNGHLYRDVLRMVNQDRNVFGASMVAHGHADAMVTGLTRSFGVNHEYITRVLDPKPGHRLMTCSLVVTRSTALFIADTNINEEPDAIAMADIAIQTAEKAKSFGYEPRVALLSFSNFGSSQKQRTERLEEAITLARELDPDVDDQSVHRALFKGEALIGTPKPPDDIAPIWDRMDISKGDILAIMGYPD